MAATSEKVSLPPRHADLKPALRLSCSSCGSVVAPHSQHNTPKASSNTRHSLTRNKPVSVSMSQLGYAYDSPSVSLVGLNVYLPPTCPVVTPSTSPVTSIIQTYRFDDDREDAFAYRCACESSKCEHGMELDGEELSASYTAILPVISPDPDAAPSSCCPCRFHQRLKTLSPRLQQRSPYQYSVSRQCSPSPSFDCPATCTQSSPRSSCQYTSMEVPPSPASASIRRHVRQSSTSSCFNADVHLTLYYAWTRAHALL